MLPEAFAVVGGEHDCGVFRHGFEHARDVVVGEGHLRVVLYLHFLLVLQPPGPATLGIELAVQFIRRMRVRVVNPGEERLGRVAPGEHAQRGFGDFIGGALGLDEPPAPLVEIVLVDVEAAVEPAQLRLQRPVALHAQRGVAGGAEQFLHHGDRVGHAQAVARGAGGARILRGQHGAHGGESERHLADAVVKDQGFLRERVDAGGGVKAVAVAAEPVGAQGVYRQEQHVLRFRPRGKRQRRGRHQQGGQHVHGHGTHVTAAVRSG